MKATAIFILSLQMGVDPSENFHVRWEGVLLIKSGVMHSGRLLHPETGLSSPTNSVCRPASLPTFLLCTMIISGFWFCLQHCSVKTLYGGGLYSATNNLVGACRLIRNIILWRFIPCCAVQLLRWDGWQTVFWISLCTEGAGMLSRISEPLSP
ncbi:unnamed protein product [Sphagnum jensenii]|uniref:Uncharacterized protein n=1 Tax=Sphagnum jensenii TaxID=128206 RepID=A0ABP1B8T5_9BRYO